MKRTEEANMNRPHGINRAKTAVFIALTVFFGFGGTALAEDDSTPKQFLFRLEVEDGKGDEKETVSISVPVDLLDSIWECLPEDCQEKLETSGIQREEVLRDLVNTQEKELVRVEEENETVRIWLEPVTKENREALSSLRIHVLNAEEEVSICLPTGLIRLGLVLSDTFGFWDKGMPIEQAVTGCDKHKEK